MIAESEFTTPAFTRILVDADSLLYRCGFAAEGEPVSHACQSLKIQIQKIKESLGTENAEFYIKGEGNFREELSVSAVYKGTRPTAKPTAYDDLRKYIIEVHGARPVDGMEADDAVSVELFKNRDRDSGVVLAAIDKDLWNTPGWHFNYDPRKSYLEYVTQAAADRSFMLQLLQGDKTDNIPGLPLCAQETIDKYKLSFQARKGCGAGTAERLLSGLESLAALDRAWEAYLDYGRETGWDDEVTRKYFLEQGRLLWMTRGLNSDGSPVLWEIPGKCKYWEY